MRSNKRVHLHLESNKFDRLSQIFMINMIYSSFNCYFPLFVERLVYLRRILFMSETVFLSGLFYSNLFCLSSI